MPEDKEWTMTEIMDLLKNQVHPICDECKYSPVCSGKTGCPYTALLKAIDVYDSMEHIH